MLGILGFRCAGGSRKPSIAFSAMGVDSRSSIFGVGSNTAAVAGPVDIIAMMGGDDDAAAAGAAGPPLWPPPTRPPVPATAAEAKADLVGCCGTCGRLIGMKLPTRGLALDVHE